LRREAAILCRESPPPALAGERPKLNNVSRAVVDQRDSIHNARLIPPCIIGKNVSIENCTIGPNVTIGDNCKLKNLTMKDCIMWDNEETGYSHFENQIIASC
jgi:glucose-1-phosphate thymidylyltransferase